MDSIGLCHKCLATNVRVRNYDEKGILCQECFGKFYNKKSPENEPQPTLNDLKKKMERNW